MSAYGWLERFLFLVSASAWTRDTLAIVTTTTCPDGRVSCPGYQDDYANKYCCPSPGWVQPGGYYCCNYQEKEKYSSDHYQNIPEIIGGVVGAAFLLASVVVLSCFFCPCCYIYKYRHRKRNAAESAPRRSPSSLGWRYRNWPRASLVPSMSSCNGHSSGNGYYYGNRPFREAPPSSSYHRHHHRRPLASSPPRHSSAHSRLHSYRGGGESCCQLENNDFAYAIRSPTDYSPYLYEHLNSILEEGKPFEAPPPYPIAQYYPACPPISVQEMQTGPVPPAISPISTSASAATTSTVIQDDATLALSTTNSGLEMSNGQSTAVANGGLDCLASPKYSPKLS